MDAGRDGMEGEGGRVVKRERGDLDECRWHLVVVVVWRKQEIWQPKSLT